MQIHSTPALEEERLAQQQRPERAAALLVGSAVSQGQRPSPQLTRLLSAQATLKLTIPPAGSGDLNSDVFGRIGLELLNKSILNNLPAVHPEYTWMLYGYLLSEGMPRHPLTFHLAAQHAQRLLDSPTDATDLTRLYARAPQLTLQELRESWKHQHLPGKLNAVTPGEVAETLLGRVPLQGGCTLHLYRIGGELLLAHTQIAVQRRSYQRRLLEIQQHLTPLGIHAGDTILSLICPNDAAAAPSLSGLRIRS